MQALLSNNNNNNNNSSAGSSSSSNNSSSNGGNNAGSNSSNNGSKKFKRLYEVTTGCYSVYAVVAAVTGVKRTAGTDFSKTLILVDESKPSEESGLHVSLFFRDQKMQLFVEAGDIVRMQNVEFVRRSDRLVGGGKIGGPNGFGCLVINNGAEKDPIRPRNITSQVPNRFSSEALVDIECVTSLRKWWAIKNSAGKQILPPPTNFRKMLYQLGDETFCDIVCCILGRERLQGQRNRMILWDGTGSVADSAVVVEVQVDDPPILGVLIQLNVWPESLSQFSSVEPGQWVFLRNVKCKTYGGHYEIHYQQTLSQARCLAANDPLVYELCSNYDVRLENEGELALLQQPQQQQRQQLQKTRDALLLAEEQHNGAVVSSGNRPRQIVTVAGHSEQKMCTLSNIKNCKQVPSKFRCTAKVVDFFPHTVQNFTCAMCVTCASDVCSNPLHTKEYVYMFRLSIEDDTDFLDVILYGDDALQFLCNLPPTNLHENNCSLASLQQTIDYLLLDDVYITCCIKSYRDKSHNRRYRMFDTMLQQVTARQQGQQ